VWRVLWCPSSKWGIITKYFCSCAFLLVGSEERRSTFWFRSNGCISCLFIKWLYVSWFITRAPPGDMDWQVHLVGKRQNSLHWLLPGYAGTVTSSVFWTNEGILSFSLATKITLVVARASSPNQPRCFPLLSLMSSWEMVWSFMWNGIGWHFASYGLCNTNRQQPFLTDALRVYTNLLKKKKHWWEQSIIILFDHCDI